MELKRIIEEIRVLNKQVKKSKGLCQDSLIKPRQHSGK